MKAKVVLALHDGLKELLLAMGFTDRFPEEAKYVIIWEDETAQFFEDINFGGLFGPLPKFIFVSYHKDVDFDPDSIIEL